MAEQSETECQWHFDLLLVLLLVAVAALLVFSFLSARQEKFTLLYFEPNALPSTASAGKALSFDFLVENQEGSAMEYSFTVFAESEEKTVKAIELLGKEKKRFSETVVFKKPSAEKQKVSVQLKKPSAEKPQEIFFWVAVSD